MNKEIVAVADAGITFENVNLESFVVIARNIEFTDNMDVEISKFEPIRKYSPNKVLQRLPSIDQNMMRKADSIMLANLCSISKGIIRKVQQQGEFLENVPRDVFRGLYIPDSTKREILDKGRSRFVNKVPDVALYAIKRVRSIDLSEVDTISEKDRTSENGTGNGCPPLN